MVRGRRAIDPCAARQRTRSLPRTGTVTVLSLALRPISLQSDPRRPRDRRSCSLALCLLLLPALTGCDAFLGDWRLDASSAGSSSTGAGGSGGADGAGGGQTAAPLPAWCRFYGTPAEEVIYDVRLAKSGEGLLVAGQFAGELPLDPTIVPSGSTDGFLARFDFAGEPTLVSPLGASEYGVLAAAVAVEPDGLLGFGSFVGAAGRFGSDASGNSDVIVADFTGGPLLAAGSVATDGVSDADAAGDLLVFTGEAEAGMDFGTGPLSSGGYVAFMDRTSATVNAAVALGAGSSPGLGHMARFDAHGDVWVSAVLGGPGITDVVCGGRPLVTEVPGQSALFQLAPDGSCKRGRVLPTSLRGDIDMALVDGLRPLLSGRFLGELTVDDFHATSSGTETDAFVLVFDEEGQATQLTAYGGLGAEKPDEVVVSPSGFVFVVGEFAGQLTIGNVHAGSVDGEEDMFVLKLSPSGDPIWLRALGGAGRQTATGLALDAQGDLFVGGYAEGSLACASPAPQSSGGNDFYLMRFDGETL